MRPKFFLLFSLAAALPAAAHNLVETDGEWHGSLAVGGSSSSGNTSAQALNLNAEISRSSEVDKISAYSVINLGDSKTDGVRTRSAELYRLGGRYDFNLSDDLFAFVGGEGEANRPAGTRSRANANTGVGWRLVSEQDNTWEVFTGAGHIDTHFVDGSRRRGVEVLLGQESNHQLGQKDNLLKQRFVYYGGTGSLGRRATFDISLATAIGWGWTFNGGFSWRYNDQVAVGLRKRDSLLTFGLGYKF